MVIVGDNDSTFDQLQSSISGLVTMNMFGIPLVVRKERLR